MVKQFKKMILQNDKPQLNLVQQLDLHLLVVTLQDQRLLQLLHLRDRGARQVELQNWMTQDCQWQTASS